MMSAGETHVAERVDADRRMKTDQKTPAWQFILLFILTVSLIIALILTRQTPRSLLILSIMPPLMFSYAGWSRELPWKKLPNIPTAIYLIYCSVVLWYVRPAHWHVYTLGPLSVALFCCWRALRHRRISRSVTPGAD